MGLQGESPTSCEGPPPLPPMKTLSVNEAFPREGVGT